MEFHIVLALLCIVAGCCIFLGHAAGYRRGYAAGKRAGWNKGYDTCEALYGLNGKQFR